MPYLKIVELQGRPCSGEELDYLRQWAQAKIHWSARIQQAIIRPDGYLIQVDTNSFTEPQWYGINFDELERTIQIAPLRLTKY